MKRLFGESGLSYFAEPRGTGWYVADIAGHDLLRVTYPTKRAAVRAIRLMTPERERSETQTEEQKRSAIL